MSGSGGHVDTTEKSHVEAKLAQVAVSLLFSLFLLSSSLLSSFFHVEAAASGLAAGSFVRH